MWENYGDVAVSAVVVKTKNNFWKFHSVLEPEH